MKLTTALPSLLTMFVLSMPASAQSSGLPQSPAPAGAKVYIVNLENGAKVKSPFKVIFGLSGMGIAPAGIEKDNTGHHHLLINTALEGPALQANIPADAKHVHFGLGQTEAMVALPAGQHVLQMVLGDHNHIPHVPPIVSEKVTIIVE
jgi:Domain of unknown function (DUF4399)